MRIAIVTNSAWNLYNFRLGLIKALVSEGHHVDLVAAPDEYASKLVVLGFNFVPIHLRPAGTNPIEELRVVLSLRTLLRRLKSDVVLSFTPKGNIYSLISCIGSRRFCIPNISGLGSVFLRESILRRLLTLTYWLSLRRAHAVVFQNPDDKQLFLEKGIACPDRAVLVPGSGIDLERFCIESRKRIVNSSLECVFLMVSRPLRDKGIVEYFEAAEMLVKARKDCKFLFCGPLNCENPSSVEVEQLLSWFRRGPVQYIGHASDVREAIGSCSVLVLPSYREGLPKVVLEAGALAVPVITTDVAGCKHAVLDQVTGILVEPRSSVSLAEGMNRMIDMGQGGRELMGMNARKFVIEFFNECIVHRKYSDMIAHVSRQGRVRRSIFAASEIRA